MDFFLNTITMMGFVVRGKQQQFLLGKNVEGLQDFFDDILSRDNGFREKRKGKFRMLLRVDISLTQLRRWNRIARL